MSRFTHTPTDHFVLGFGADNLPELGEDELGSPHFSLASEAVGSDETKSIQLRIMSENCEIGGRAYKRRYVWHAYLRCLK